jgi:excisionase family DNA binding protein
MMTDKAYEMFSDYEDVVTVDDVIKMLHIGKNSVYDLLKNHRIESIKVGSRYVIPKKSVINFLNI